MSHLTCNKAERITCSLPVSFLKVSLYHFIVSIFFRSSAARVGIFPRRGTYQSVFIATAAFFTEHINPKPAGIFKMDSGIFIKYEHVMPRD